MRAAGAADEKRASACISRRCGGSEKESKSRGEIKNPIPGLSQKPIRQVRDFSFAIMFFAVSGIRD